MICVGNGTSSDPSLYMICLETKEENESILALTRGFPTSYACGFRSMHRVRAKEGEIFMSLEYRSFTSSQDTSYFFSYHQKACCMRNIVKNKIKQKTANFTASKSVLDQSRKTAISWLGPSGVKVLKTLAQHTGRIVIKLAERTTLLKRFMLINLEVLETALKSIQGYVDRSLGNVSHVLQRASSSN